MRDDFCIFILTNRRPDKVCTYKLLKKSGYTGKIYLVIDDEDPTGDQYSKNFGEENILSFSKSEIEKRFDEADNFHDRRAIFYARNACLDLAKKVKCKYYMQLDDDYNHFSYRYNSALEFKNKSIRKTFEELLNLLIGFLDRTPALSVALSQGGDHIGGKAKSLRLKRKAMNSFICSIDRPFKFIGRVNEDVNTYVHESRKGNIFFTVMQVMLNQLQTQRNSGGMTEMYLDGGTYLKSFYSVMIEPSCVKIGQLIDSASPHPRIHHDINWDNAAVRIISEKHKKL